MNKILILIILSMFLLVGCEEEKEKVTCPVVSCPEPEPIVEEAVFVHFIDVDNGDATLIQDGQMEMLIDCGKNTQGMDIVEFLKEKNVGLLEYLVISNTDSNNLGGCDDVLREIPVNTVIVNGEVIDSSSYKEVEEEIDDEQKMIVDEFDDFILGEAEILVLHSSKNSENPNENSIVLRMTYGDTSFLFASNCEGKCEEDMIFRKADILKVSNHGAKTSTSLKFLEKVEPKIAIISVGAYDDYGYPSKEVMDRLSQEGVSIYKTEDKGTITIKSNGKGYTII